MVARRSAIVLSILASVVLACPDSDPVDDLDAGLPDASALDAAEPDASVPDAASPDALPPDADAGPQTCSANDDCPDGEFCYGGVCAGEACEDVECPDDRECYAGSCFDVCADSTDCEEPDRCHAGRCTPAACEGVVCRVDEFCESGGCFSPCSDTNGCPEPDACWDGRCAPGPCDDIQCTTEQLCHAGSCTDRCGSAELGCSDRRTCADEPCLFDLTCTDGAGPGDYTCAECTVDCPIFRALAGPDVEFLAGTTVLLNGDAVGANGGFTCEWTNDVDATVLSTCVSVVAPMQAETEFTLTVTDASGATASDTFIAAQIPFRADAGPSFNIELGRTATLTAGWQGASCSDGACVTCDWTLSDGSPVASTCTATVGPEATTQYFLEVTDGGSGNVAQDDTTVYVTDQPARLCGWDVVVMTSNEYPSSPNPNYICDENETARRQLVNGKPAIVLSDLDVENVRIRGEIGVVTTSDDDLIGVLWGWEDPKHAYLMSWKQANQAWTARCGNALAGIAVKKIDGARTDPDTISFNSSFGFNATDYVYGCADLWSTDRNNDALLEDDTIFLLSPRDDGAFAGGWRDNVIYRIDVYYTPTRTKIFVEEAPAMSGQPGTPVTDFTIVDSSYPRGAFAFFSNSQAQVAFGDFVLASLDGYAADAGPDRAIEGGESATLSGAATLGVPPITCSWADASTVVGTECEIDVMPASTTTYTLTVTDDFGRRATDDATVAVGP